MIQGIPTKYGDGVKIGRPRHGKSPGRTREIEHRFQVASLLHKRNSGPTHQIDHFRSQSCLVTVENHDRKVARRNVIIHRKSRAALRTAVFGKTDQTVTTT